MTDNLETRLAALREEQRKGTEMLQGLEQQSADLRATLLRIEGAIQVLEELREAENRS